jgi:hypothetical protein
MMFILFAYQSKAQSTRESIQGKWQAHQVHTRKALPDGEAMAFDSFPRYTSTRIENGSIMRIEPTFFTFDSGELTVSTSREEHTVPYNIGVGDRLTFTLKDQAYVYDIGFVNNYESPSFILISAEEDQDMITMVHLDRVK